MMKPGVAKAALPQTVPQTVKDAAATSSAAIEPGQPAPAFALKSLAGQPVTLASMKGRVVVVVFGSYSTPSFRQRVPALEKLAKDYSTRATVLVVYTREAHAVGEWEVDRNKEDNIAVEQPKTDAERKTLATQAVSTLKITVPVLLDDMENSTAKAYGLTPNGAVIINRDGSVAARQHWFEPIGLRAQIDAAISVKNVAKE
jgi:peroxiredoxin